MKLLVKHHADKRHQHNQPVAAAAEKQMVVKDTGIAHDIGRICRSAWSSGHSVIDNHNRFAFIDLG